MKKGCSYYHTGIAYFRSFGGGLNHNGAPERDSLQRLAEVLSHRMDLADNGWVVLRILGIVINFAEKTGLG